MKTIPTEQIEPGLAEMIALLDVAVEAQTAKGCCKAVIQALTQIVQSGQDFVPDKFLAPAPHGYARRLVHRDPAGRYTVLALVWGVGQGTALHDHAGIWCVDCVYRGRILVKSYSLQGQTDDRYSFAPEQEILAGVGEAGALIPPFEYHTLENAEADRPSVTLHVYGGEMNWCHVFCPSEGGYVMERRELAYTDF